MGFIQTDKLELLVAGETITANIGEDLLIGPDLSEEMDTVAAQLQWWGGVLAAAKAEAEQLDAAYRQWRARESLVILEKDKTLAEWKVKLRLEASDKFMRHKNAKALAIRNIEQLERVVEAWRVKAAQMQSKGANIREGMAVTGLSTPARRRDKPSIKSGKGEKVREPSDEDGGDEEEEPTPSASDRDTAREARLARVRAKTKKRKE